MITNLELLFKEWCGTAPEKIIALEPAGSDRRYFRMIGGPKPVLGVFNQNVKENEAYFAFTKHFRTFKINVPKIVKVSQNQIYYLVEDLGDDSLYKRVMACNNQITPEVIGLYKKSLKALIKMQVTAGKSVNYNVCFPISKFNAKAIQWDLNYFKYNFLKLSGVEFDEYLLEKDFESLSDFLLNAPATFFMFRDFQARNIIIKDEEPWFIDFQGGRQGPVSYDVASLLYQAKTQIPDEVRNELFEYYFSQLSKVLTVDYAVIVSRFKGFALLRTLQVLGAYGFRGYFEKKPHFIDSIPFALANLKSLIQSREIPVGMPHLAEIVSKFDNTIPVANSLNGLTILVTSFSYRKGIPADTTGNGGGFVFDCRGIHNPGRYPQYQSLTGKDVAVIEFFKQETNIETYLNNVINLVEPSVQEYINRGFQHLMVNFGCTGGQHRSVYCAENFVKFLMNKYNVNVVLWHREQNERVQYDKKM